MTQKKSYIKVSDAIKKIQKELAKEIKDNKGNRKEDKRKELNLQLSDIDFKIWHLKRKYRHRHIAYCELRGVPYEKIESPREGNEPDRHWVDVFKEEWIKKIEALCDNS